MVIPIYKVLPYFVVSLLCMTQFACKLGVVVVGPGALKPSDGDGIESRRPLLHSFYSSFLIIIMIIIIIIILNPLP